MGRTAGVPGYNSGSTSRQEDPFFKIYKRPTIQKLIRYHKHYAVNRNTNN
jgi:hypothetical protein